jgi:hypothetical protein
MKLTGPSEAHPFPGDQRREPILVHPEVRDRLVNLLHRDEMRAVGYSEFLIRAIDLAEEELADA